MSLLLQGRRGVMNNPGWLVGSPSLTDITLERGLSRAKNARPVGSRLALLAQTKRRAKAGAGTRVASQRAGDRMSRPRVSRRPSGVLPRET